MIVLVTGGRNYGERIEERERLHDALAQLRPTCVVHGYARGADRIARQWTSNRDILAMGFRAEWELDGKSAGPARNARMVAWVKERLRLGESVIVLACPGGKGTADCVRQALRAGLSVKTLDEVLGPEIGDECACGHVRDEHGRDGCTCCECIHFEKGA